MSQYSIDNLFYYDDKHFKEQIVLCHTSRPLQFYKNSLMYRLDGDYRKIPTYIISKKGETIQNFDENYYSDFIGVEYIDKKVIVICLENLGWLNYNQLNNKYANWIGDIYKGDVYQKRWRDHTYWSAYSDKQIKVTAKLIKMLCTELHIPLKLIGHNTRVDGIEDFKGITTRSNYNDLWTDLSPSFDFEKLKQYINE